MPDKEKIEEDVEEVAEKVAEEVTESTKEAIEKAGKKASEEVEKAGKKAAKEIKSSAEETEVFTVNEGSTIAGKTVEEIDEKGVIGEDALMVELERDDEKLTPKGDTVLQPGDTVTITSSNGISDKTRDAFTEE